MSNCYSDKSPYLLVKLNNYSSTRFYFPATSRCCCGMLEYWLTVCSVEQISVKFSAILLFLNYNRLPNCNFYFTDIQSKYFYIFIHFIRKTKIRYLNIFSTNETRKFVSLFKQVRMESWYTFLISLPTNENWNWFTFLDTTIYKGEQFTIKSILNIHTHLQASWNFSHFTSSHPPGKPLRTFQIG